MEAQLLKLLGLALAHTALARSGQRAPLLATDGQDIIAACLERDAKATAKVVSQAMEAFWSDLSARQIEPEELRQHISAVRDLLMMADCLAQGELRAAPAASPTGNPQDEAALMAGAIASCASTSKCASSTSPEKAEATLRSLFGALLATGTELNVCLETAAAFAVEKAAEGAAQPNPDAERSLERQQQELAADTGISLDLLKAMVEAQLRLGSSREVIIRTLVDRTVSALELLADLTHLADRVGSDDRLESELLNISGAIRSGAFTRARADLAVVSRDLDRAKDRDRFVKPDLTGTAFLPTLLAAKARLASLDGAPREAARLYERAVEIWPREDRIRRWQLKIAQARQLVELGSLPKARINSLCEAAQAYAAAGGLVSERDCPLPWAEANLELGTLLLMLGHRECRPERYLAAALHFKPAIEVFTRERALDGWARSQIGLAHALRGQASFQGDVVIAREAAFAYRAALGILTEDGSADLWHEARCALAETLVRIAEEAGDIEALNKAIDLLMGATETAAHQIGEPARSLGDIALGRAMLFLVETGLDLGELSDVRSDDDEKVLSDAIELISNGLTRGAAHLTILDRAWSERCLGAAQSLLFARTGNIADLEAAIATRQRARDLYRQLDNLIEAEAMAHDLAELKSLLKRQAGERDDASDRSGPDAFMPHTGAHGDDDPDFDDRLADVFAAGGGNRHVQPRRASIA